MILHSIAVSVSRLNEFDVVSSAASAMVLPAIVDRGVQDVPEALQRETQGKSRFLSEILGMILNHGKKTEKTGPHRHPQTTRTIIQRRAVLQNSFCGI
jgi:hypothetical protein